MPKPTYQDAALLLQLAQWHLTSDMLAAVSWLWSDHFVPDYGAFLQVYPPGSAEAADAVR